MKKPDWAGQLSPQAQMICVLSGLEGQVSNLADGLHPTVDSVENMQLLVDYLKKLAPAMPLAWED